MSISDAQYQLWLESPGKLRCALFKLTFAGNNGGALGEFAAYISNMPYVTGPSDTPANKIFDACVVECPAFTESMGEQLDGRSKQSYGDLIWANPTVLDANGFERAEGVRDSWYSMNWDGRRIEQWLGDPGWAFADFRKVLDGITVDVFDPGGYKGGFHISDKSALLARPVMTTLLGGSEANANDLMPLCLGSSVSNITPKLTDHTTHTYRVTGVDAGGLIESIWVDAANPVNPVVVYEDQVPLFAYLVPLPSSNAATDLLHIVGHGFVANTLFILRNPTGLATAPAPLAFDTFYWVCASGLTADDFKASATFGGAAIDITGAQSGSLYVDHFGWTPLASTGSFKLAGNPSGVITCDTYGLATGSPQTQITKAGQIANQVLTSGLTNTPFASADIDATSLSAFNTLCTASLGNYLTERVNFDDLLDQLVLSVGGWWGLSSVGKLVLGRLDLPAAGTPVYSFNAGDVAIRSLSIVRRILPRAQIKVAGTKNWTVQTTILGSVSEDTRVLAAMEYRNQATGAPTVTTFDTDPTSHRSAVYPETFKTLLTQYSDIAAEATRLATLFQYPTAIFGFDTHHAAYLLHRGDLIYVDHPKYTGYGIVTSVTKRVKGRSRVEFFCQIPDVYPTADIA